MKAWGCNFALTRFQLIFFYKHGIVVERCNYIICLMYAIKLIISLYMTAQANKSRSRGERKDDCDDNVPLI